MDEVKGTPRQVRLPDVTLLQFHVVQPFRASVRGCRIQERSIGIKAQHATARPDVVRQRAQNTHAAAANVGTGPPRHDADPFQHGLGIRFPYLCLNPEALRFVIARQEVPVLSLRR